MNFQGPLDIGHWGLGMDPDWEIMELSEPLHSRSLKSLSYHIFPSIWYLDLYSHISPGAKLNKVPELFGDPLMPD
jgi:hypothetical protein